jgi:hypothetical protein
MEDKTLYTVSTIQQLWVGREAAAKHSHETNSCDIDLVIKPLRHAQAEGKGTIFTPKENSTL